jgi:hypothetical protein
MHLLLFIHMDYPCTLVSSMCQYGIVSLVKESKGKASPCRKSLENVYFIKNELSTPRNGHKSKC